MANEPTTNNRGWKVALVVAILATVLTVTFVAVSAYKEMSCDTSRQCTALRSSREQAQRREDARATPLPTTPVVDRVTEELEDDWAGMTFAEHETVCENVWAIGAREASKVVPQLTRRDRDALVAFLNDKC